MNERITEGTAGIFRKGFAVFALAGLLAAAAVMTGCEDALAALEGDEDSKKTEEQAAYDADGWNLDDLTDNTNENGTLFSDVDGLDRQGYDVDGWNGKDLTDMENKNGTLYGADELDRQGYDAEGWNGKDPGDMQNKNGTLYDAEGYDRQGYDTHGWNREGQNTTGTSYDDKGFKADGTYQDTGSLYDSNGYDRDGYDEDGYDKKGIDKDGYNKSGYDKEGYNKQGYNDAGFDRDGYNADGKDAEGYNKQGWNDEGTNKTTKTKYNTDGYDVDGYNQNGLHKDTHKNREGGNYGLNGKDWNGNAMPALLAGLNLDNEDIFVNSAKDVIVPVQSGYIYLSSVANDTANAQNGIISMMNKPTEGLISQSASLAYAYQQVANNYSGLQTMAQVIATQEKITAVGTYTTMTDWSAYNDTYGTNIAAIWNAVFNGKEAAKTKFDAYLAAYKAGLASNQSVRSEKRTELNSAFTTAISTLNLSPYNESLATPSTDGTTQAKTNNAAIIATLKTKLLEQINAVMEVDSNVNIAADQTTLKNLNEILLQQTGDVEELRAFVADVKAIPSSSYNVRYAGGMILQSYVNTYESGNATSIIPVGSKITVIPTTIAMGTQKLNDLINGFDPEYLKLKQQVAGKDEIALV
jgi:hypothetical protein